MSRRIVLVFFLCAVALAQSSISREAAWKDFTTWLQKQPPNSKPGELISGYRENLVRQGLSKDETANRMNLISDFIFTRQKGVELLWDKVFAGDHPIFVQTPSAILVSATEGKKPAKRSTSEPGKAAMPSISPPKVGTSLPSTRLPKAYASLATMPTRPVSSCVP